MEQPNQLHHRLYRNRRSSSIWRQQQQQQQQQQLSDNNNKNNDIQESSDDENNNLLPNEQQQQPVLLPPTSRVIEEDEEEYRNDIIPLETKPPTNYLEKPNHQQPPNDRLTLLKEPDDYLSVPGVSGRQVIPNRINLSTSATADEPSKLSAFTSATAADQRELNSHLNHQMFLLGSSSMLLLILIIAILYNWLYRRRSRAKRGTTTCYQVVVDQHSPLLPSCCGDFGGSGGKQWKNREKRNNRSTSFAEDDAADANNRQQLQQQQQQQRTGGEQIQLIDRRPQPPEDTIQVINSSSTQTPPSAAILADDRERKLLSSSNLKVILKRKLAKNSLVVSAKERAKPKVKLIKTQVRKFIDEEAQEIRMKREQELTLAWHSQVVAFFLEKFNLSNMNISDKTQLEDTATATAAAADVDEGELNAMGNTREPIETAVQDVTCLSEAVESTVEAADEQSTIDVQDVDNNNHRLSVEIHHQETAVIEEEQQQQLQVVNLLLSEQHKPQLSPSPVAACSSISACSLFADNSSSSPNEQQHLQHLHSSCGCPTLNHLLIDSHNHHHHNHHQAHLKDPYSPASNHLYNSNHQSSDLRSKSQGHTPCQMSSSFRPCCSTSPSTFNSLLTGVVDQQQQQQHRQQCCITPLMLPATATSNQTSTIHNLSSNNTAGNGSGGIHSGRCSNRIKRQYENYYDDEREDTYRKLSIGINYAAAAAAAAVPLPTPSDNHLEELLSLNRYASNAAATCHQHHHLANHQVPQQSAFFATQQQDSHLSSSAAVAPSAAAAAAYSAPMLQQQQSLVARSGCRCCNQSAGSATNGAVISSAPVAFNEQPFSDVAEQQQQHLLTRSTFHDQQQHLLFDNKGYLFSRSGSELLSASSGSTSLGGSDSGFINISSSLSASRANNNSSSNTCRNPLCSCQLPASHPMSILVQQPSMSTPPPPVAPDLSSITPLEGSANSGAQLEPEVPGSGIESVVAENSSAEVQTTTTTTGIAARPKWKHRRRLSHNHSHHLFSGLQQQQQVHLCNNDIRAAPSRRMSIAGDRLTSSQQQRSAPVDSAQSPATTTTVSPLPQHNQHQHHHLPLQHRASVAADGSWGFSRATCSPVLRQYNNSAVNYYRSQNQTPAEGVPTSASNAHQQQQHNHRPSDASLYDTSAVSNSSYCSSAAHLSGTCCGSVSNGSACGGKSNHSSSGGSSSGIGISGGGSACTNTPTSCAFPYGSFGTNVSRTEILTGGTGPLTRDSSLYYNQHHHHHHHHNHPLHYHHQYLPPIGGGYLHDSICTDSTCQAASCTTSRKYSLPVQLESHSAERLSPSRSRPLFEKNSLLHQQQQQPADLPANSGARQAGGFPNGIDQQATAAAHCRRGRLSESRRNSQTITRQSSFWLDEDSAVFTLNDDNNNHEDNDDSHLTTTASNLNQQVFLECAEQQQVVAQEAAIVASQPQPHQRLSTSSIILSADSIESVKLKPKEVSSSVNQEDQPLATPLVDNQEVVENNHQVEASHELDSLSADEEEEKQNDDDNDDTNKRPFKSSPGNAKKTSRLSSTSTSSTNSSPSPDFSACRPPTSERILSGSTKKSSGVSKRNLIGKIRTRRYPHIRLSNRNSAASESIKSNVPVVESLSSDKIQDTTNVSGESSEQQTKTDTPDKQTTEINSSSLERQCRELWKLRAALHDDSCVGDNWSNYHQRLSRRYDSGYKSIENQLSSSLEGNLLVSSSTVGGNQPLQPARQQSQQQVSTTTDEPQRPQSGCSHLPPSVSKGVDDEYNETSSEEQTLLSPTSTSELEGKTTETTTTNTSHKSKSAEDLANQQEQQSSTDTIQGKLADLELDDIALECLISCNTPSDRDCNSRSSKSSSNEDEEKKTRPLRTQCRTPEV